MKKNISRNPLWPDWYNGKKIDEVQFGRAFLEQWPLKCVNGTLYTLDGPVEIMLQIGFQSLAKLPFLHLICLYQFADSALDIICLFYTSLIVPTQQNPLS